MLCSFSPLAECKSKTGSGPLHCACSISRGAVAQLWYASKGCFTLLCIKSTVFEEAGLSVAHTWWARPALKSCWFIRFGFEVRRVASDVRHGGSANRPNLQSSSAGPQRVHYRRPPRGEAHFENLERADPRRYAERLLQKIGLSQGASMSNCSVGDHMGSLDVKLMLCMV